jgi:predicted secreted Zn-dependent protease
MLTCVSRQSFLKIIEPNMKQSRASSLPKRQQSLPEQDVNGHVDKYTVNKSNATDAWRQLPLAAAGGYGDGFLAQMAEHVRHLMADHRDEQQHYLTEWAAGFERRIVEAIQPRLQELVRRI